MSDLTYATIGVGTVMVWLMLYAAFTWKASRTHRKALQGHYYDETHPGRPNVRRMLYGSPVRLTPTHPGGAEYHAVPQITEEP